MTNRLLIILTLTLGIILNQSCQREEEWAVGSEKLYFSSDTISFDTVFTTIGSVTKKMLIYNRNDKPIKISSVKLQGGTNSYFKINIDGITGPDAYDVEIMANDSVFLFIQVYIDPTQQNAPVLISDSIIFNVNNNTQKVQLQAFGQDVHLIKSKNYFSTINTNTTWASNKPYLIYDTLHIDSAATLTIEAGAIIYLHKNANIIVDGNIVANGTYEQKIVFRGDRLDTINYATPISYDKVPGQWGSIWFRNSSSANKLTYTEIRNGTIGLWMGVLNEKGKASIELENVIVQNNSFAGIFANNAKVKAYNTLIANNGFANFFAATGGDYEFIHCTFANYSIYRSDNPSIVLTNIIKYDEIEYFGDLTNAHFANCIIWGNAAVEFSTLQDEKYSFNYLLEKCYIKDNDNSINTQDKSHFKNITRSGENDPGFKSIVENKYNFRLKKIQGSKIINAGNDSIAKLYPFDFDKHSRVDDIAPDLGAFEYIPE
jgi:hypothetical protein